ncbi:MAG: hypothetical protein ACI97N_000845 [Cognaticolwellia sp.]|jgi:hypothetical protein
MKNNIFKEESSFNDKVIFTILGIGLVGAILGYFTSFYGEYPATKTAAYFIVALGLGVSLWVLLQLKLKVSINDKHIEYKMFPIHYKTQRITWDEIESCEIIETSYYAQWHGGNIRFNEAWFSLTGRNGLAIRTKAGKSLFIGCKNVTELAQYLALNRNISLEDAEISAQTV